MQRDKYYPNLLSHPWIIIYPPFEQLGKISKEEQFSVDKVPTQGKYLIENDSIGPPVTQKIP